MDYLLLFGFDSVSDSVIATLIAVLIVFVILLTCREIVCWYWKINAILLALENLDSCIRFQNEQICQINASLQAQNAQINYICQILYAMYSSKASSSQVVNSPVSTETTKESLSQPVQNP